MSNVKDLCGRLKNVFRAVGHAIGIIDTHQDYQNNDRGSGTRRKRKSKVTNKTAKRRSRPVENVTTPKTNVKDIYVLGASLQMLNHHTGKQHKRDENDELFDDFDYLEYDDDTLYEEDGHYVDCVDDAYPLIDDNISSAEDIDEF